MEELKFIGTINEELARKVVTSSPWGFKEMVDIPYPVVGTPNGYLLTVGSACLSLATSAHGTAYYGAIDVIRWDFSKRAVDVDHYITPLVNNTAYGVFLTPPTDYHHLKATDQLVSNLSWSWQKMVTGILPER